MITKPFSPNLYKENDAKSREVVMCLLKKHGITCKNNPDKYGVDILVIDHQETPLFGVEVERRPNWKTEKFPFNTVHIPGRKLKFLKDGKNHYAIVSSNFSIVGLAKSNDLFEIIKNNDLVEVKNKFVDEGEEFIDVPQNLFGFFDAKTGKRI